MGSRDVRRSSGDFCPQPSGVAAGNGALWGRSIIALRIAFYGDDFTGSTDAMEVLARAGVRTVLFLEPPTAEVVAAYADIGAIGVAGVSRSLPTSELRVQLPPIFLALKKLGAPVFHVKICSTFDSSAEFGSIGATIEVLQEVFGEKTTPLVVGVPALGRYITFGNLFAQAGRGGPAYRLDRHPTMSRHPVTPMAESDVRRILAEQTTLTVGLRDVTELLDPFPKDENSEAILVFDTISEMDLLLVGQTLTITGWRTVVGSSGVEHALTKVWGIAPAEFPLMAAANPVLIVSGSCSPVTATQILAAERAGFRLIPLVDDWSAPPPPDNVVEALDRGESVVVHACLGPDDPRFSSANRSGDLLGRLFASLIRSALMETPLRRVVVAGGDTSGLTARALGIRTLEMKAIAATGGPLCRVGSPDPILDGIEILFKGGQVGAPDFLVRTRDGMQ